MEKLQPAAVFAKHIFHKTRYPEDDRVLPVSVYLCKDSDAADSVLL